MKITPNLGNKARLVYVVVGLAIIVGSLVMELEGWTQLIVPVLGGTSIVTGAVGW